MRHARWFSLSILGMLLLAGPAASQSQPTTGSPTAETPPAPAAVPASAAAPTTEPLAVAVDLVRARAVADGGVLCGTEGLHRHLNREMRSWGPQGRDAQGYGYAAVLSRVAYLEMQTAGDERAVVVTARAVGRERSVAVLWDGRRVADITLGQDWATFHVALEASQTEAGTHRLDLRRRKKGASFEGEPEAGIPGDAELLVHDVHLSLETPTAAQTTPAGPRDSADALWLAPGERARFLFPLPSEATLTVESLRHREAGTGGVRVEVGGEDSAPTTLAQLEGTTGGRWTLPGTSRERVTQIDLIATGPGAVALVEPRILAPPMAAPTGVGTWKPPKHVLIVLADALRADRVSGIDPSSPVKTPALDRLIREGTVFTRAITQGNYSKETACSLFTSTYNDLHRCHNKSRKLPTDIAGMQEVFKAAGFSTAGLVANGYVSKRWGYGRGWDEWHNYITMRGRLDYEKFGEGLDWGRKPRVRRTRGEVMTRDAAEWIASREGAPFFMYLHLIDPHTPYRPPREFWEPYVGYEVGKRLPLNPNNTGTYADRFNAGRHRFTDKQWAFYEALYLGEVAYTDHYVGKLIDTLESWGILDDTLLIVTADHGEGFREHETVGHGILNLYQEVIHVPLIVRYPGGIPAGRRVDEPVEQMDIAPTVIEAIGRDIPDGYQGASLLSLAREREPVMSHPAFSTMSDFLVAMELGRYKFVRWRDKDRAPEVYDRVADPGEKHDLAAERPLLTRYLEAYVDWYERVSMTWKRHADGPIGDFSSSPPSTSSSAAR